MINIFFPLLVSLNNVTFCLEKIIEKANFESLALVHTHKTVDMAETIYAKLVKDSNYVWMRFDMTNNQTLHNQPLLRGKLFRRIFFVFLIDNIYEWVYVYTFILATHFDQKENQIYIVNKIPTAQALSLVANATFNNQFYNCGALFWNTSGHGTGMKAYTFNGFLQNRIVPIPLIDDKCSNNIYNQIFFDKTINMYGTNLTIYGQTEPPRVVRTSAMVNGQYEYSISGQDVLITDAMSKTLNASVKYKIMSKTLYLVKDNEFVEGYSEYKKY